MTRDDRPRNWLIYKRVLQEEPTSVLHVGCGRGHILWRLEGLSNVPTLGLESSRHCFLTRATPRVRPFDLCRPWPVNDREFDLVVTDDFLEHLPGDATPVVVAELNRVARRGLHFIDYGASALSPAAWRSRLGGDHRTINARDYDFGAASLLYNTGPVKVNLGCGETMFHYGWWNIDAAPLDSFAVEHRYWFSRHDVRGDVPLPENRVTAIVAAHLLDRLTSAEVRVCLDRCWRWLMVGGVLRVSVPDVGRLKRMGARLAEFDAIAPEVAAAADWREKLRLLALDGRHSTYTAASLTTVLERAGFSDVKESRFAESWCKNIRSETFDTLPDISAYVEGRKLVL